MRGTVGRPVSLAFALAVSLAGVAGAAAQEPARPEVPAPPRVAAVELSLPPGEDPAAARALVAIEVGEPLASRTLRRTVQRLHQTGRYRQVIVRAVPVERPGASGSWVRLVVEGLPVRTLEDLRLRVEEPGTVDPSLLREAARLAAGQTFDDADLAPATARVRAALARKGYQAAEVEATARGEERVVVELAVRPGEPVRVGSVRLTGAPGSSADAGKGLRTRAGAALDEDVLEEDVRRLRAALAAAGYRRARVGAPRVRTAGSLADVEFPVEAGPRLSFRFRGNEEIPSEVLTRELRFEEGQPVDVPAVGAAVDRLVAFYRARGYAAARVESSETLQGEALAVVFHVDEGPRHRIRSIRFEGASHRTEGWLRSQLLAHLDEDAAEPEDAAADGARALLLSVPRATPRPTPPPALAPSEAFDEAAWDRAAERIVEAYRAEGFLEAIYLGHTVVLDARRKLLDVTLRLREGARTQVDSIGFEGAQSASIAELAREARLAPGDPLVSERVEETRKAILRIYLYRGYLYARVEVREEVDRERHAAALRFVVSEGPKVRIGRVFVSGNRRTRDAVVRRALAIHEGEPYDPDRFARGQAALLRLGVFRSVALRLQEPEVPQATKDVAVEVAERPWATLSQGVGFSIANGPRAFVEFGQPNLGGRALELTARTKVNYPLEEFRPDLAEKRRIDRLEGRADVGLRTASVSLGAFPSRLRGDVIGEIVHRLAYDLRRVTGVAGLDLGVTSRVSFSVQYEIEVDRIAKTGEGALTQVDLERLRFDDGDTTLHALRPSISLDYRDNSVHPRRGWFATGALEYARSLGAKDQRFLLGVLPGSDIHTNMLKASGTVSGYLPVGKGNVVALSLRGGRVFPLDGRSRTIIPRRFFLGGATTMRGYYEEEMIQQDFRGVLAAEAEHCRTSPTGVGCTPRGREVAGGDRPVSEGGEAFVLGKVELRMRLRGSLEAGVFADVGNLWLDPSAFRILDLRANAGFGLRFVTPIGPAALDFGFNLSPDAAINERLFAPHFTIGLF